MTALPDSMTVIEIAQPGGPEVLVPAARPIPQPAAGEVLIKVAASGVNRPDILQRKGYYEPPPGVSAIPGLEVAGEVVAVGLGVHGIHPGDRVAALLAGGGYAEYAAVPAVQCLPVPAGLNLVEAASLPETLFTVWSNIVDRARLQPGEVFLVHGGTSGIGVAAIQLAKALGARVFATAGSYEKTHACEELGAERGINYRIDDFVAVVKEATGGHGADVILDMVGGDYVPRNLTVAAIDGRIVNIAFLRGARVEVDLNLVMRKRLVLTGSTLRNRPPSEKGAIAAALRQHVQPLIEQGRFKPVIHATFPLAEASEAHRLMESSSHIGKIVLTI